jgi:hypothetical protein
MTSTIDTRTPAEIAYDSLKNGSAYTSPGAEQRSAQFAAGYQDGLVIAAAIANGDEQAIAAWIDQQAGEPEATDDMIAILEEIDGGEAEARKGIDARFDRVIDAVAELPDVQRAQAIAMWEGFLVGCAAGA